ncbi:MAG: hypothetical protein ACPG4N_07015 [Gammaproteobacteria bacterium]
MRIAVSTGVVLLISLLLFEAALRLIGFSYYWALSRSPDPILAYRPMANIHALQSQEGHALIETDRNGWRALSPSPSVSPDAIRLLILGDSMTEAVQVPVEQTYWARLPPLVSERCPEAPPIHAEILASSGYGPGQYLAAAENGFLGRQPDWVIYTHFPGNDVVEASPSLSADLMRPFPQLDATGLSLDNSFRELEEYQWKQGLGGQLWLMGLANLRSLQAVVAVYHALFVVGREPSGIEFMLEPQVDGRAFVPPRDEHWAKAWEALLASIKRIHELTQRAQARFTLVSLSTGLQVTANTELRQRQMTRAGMPHLFFQENTLRGFSDVNGIDYLALAPPMQAAAQSSGKEFHGFENAIPGLGHWNQDGHAMATQLLADHLCQAMAH